MDKEALEGKKIKDGHVPTNGKVTVFFRLIASADSL